MPTCGVWLKSLTLRPWDARCDWSQDFKAAFTPIRPILLQDNAKWNGGDPDIGLKCGPAIHPP